MVVMSGQVSSRRLGNFPEISKDPKITQGAMDLSWHIQLSTYMGYFIR